jgi:hypothetical protein
MILFQDGFFIDFPNLSNVFFHEPARGCRKRVKQRLPGGKFLFRSAQVKIDNDEPFMGLGEPG